MRMHETKKYKREEYVLRINRVLDYIDAHISEPLFGREEA